MDLDTKAQRNSFTKLYYFTSRAYTYSGMVKDIFSEFSVQEVFISISYGLSNIKVLGDFINRPLPDTVPTSFVLFGPSPS